MKLLIPIFFVLSTLPLLGADEELEVMQELIGATQKSLTAQKELYAALLAFKQARMAFIEESTSRKLATDLVKASMNLHKNLEKGHLTHLFSQDFLQEIHFFNQLGRGQKP